MRGVDVVATADAVAAGLGFVAGMVRDVHRAVADRVFDTVARGLGPAAVPSRVVHDAVSTMVHTSVRTTLVTGVRAAGRAVAAIPDPDPTPLSDRRGGRVAVAVLNGLWGDRLERDGSALDLGIALRHQGVDLPATRAALARAGPDATGRIVVFVHGLMESDESWCRSSTPGPDGPSTHGHRLRRDLGLTPVWLRYNSGRRVSRVGRDLDVLMEDLAASWPVPVSSISLVGHSMGGLVARSAVTTGAARHAAWAERVEHVVCLGSPHHGAPLEKLTNVAAWALGTAPESRPFSALLNRRSVGIKDLRFGNVSDEDWADGDPDALLRDTRVGAMLVEGVAYHAIGARVGPGPAGHLLGDTLVRQASATGRHRRRTLPFHRAVAVAEPMHHLELLDHPVAYEHVREALDPSRRA